MKSTANKQFKVGQKYSMRSICDHECIWTYTVIKRTDMMVTLQDERGNVTNCRISKGLSAFCGCECVKPLGSYSMCPVLRAE